MTNAVNSKQGSLLGATFLVAGTAIGGGMLAIPVLTALGGFWPTTVLFFLCWLFMASTGHLLMENCLYFSDETNIVTLAQRTLGGFGKVIAWILYLFLFYSLTIAYIAGGGNLIGYALGKEISPWIPVIIFVIILAPFVIFGPKAVEKINSIFFWGLIVAFLDFVIIGFPHIDATLLQRANFPKAMWALPVLFTSFGFQGIIPTLTNYLGKNGKRCAFAIWIGSLIPLITYILWEALILGVVPLEGLLNAKELGETAVYPLKDFLDKPSLFFIGKFFAFFAIVTSFFGVTLGLKDFLRDGLSLKKTKKNKFLVAFIVFIPPLFIALGNPYLFLSALHYAGGLGCALLLGLLPILMTYRGRYYLSLRSSYPLAGGKIILWLLILFILFELAITFLSFAR